MELKETKLMNTIKLSLQKDAKMLPRFIDNTSHMDRECYEIGVLIIKQLTPLVSYKVVKKSPLIRIAENINFLFDDMVKISPNISIMYFEYFTELIKSYGDLFVANEMFEAKVNFDNIKKIIDGKDI